MGTAETLQHVATCGLSDMSRYVKTSISEVVREPVGVVGCRLLRKSAPDFDGDNVFCFSRHYSMELPSESDGVTLSQCR